MRFSVIIPSRNVANLVPCVRAIRAAGEESRIVVVDDGLDASAVDQSSPDGCWLCEMDPTLRVEGVKPFIFSRNINIGIRAAGTDDVILANDDTLLQTPGGFSVLAKAAEENPEYGTIAATTNNVGNRNQEQRGVGLRSEPRMACFVCVYIPRRVIDAVGMLDEQFNCYSHQDDDYCLRVRKAGWKIGIHDGCFVDHSKLKSTFRSPGGPGGELATGAEIFRRKHGADNMSV